SVEAWIRCDNVNSASPQIIWEEGGADAGVSLYVQGGDVYGLMWTASTIRKQISASVSSGEAHHIVFVGTNTGNRCDLFIDGTSSASPTVNTATSLVPSVPTNTLLLDDAVRGLLDSNVLGGLDANGIARANGTTRSHSASVTNDWYFDGQIGDVARYNVGLSSGEVEAHYEAQRYVLAGDLLVDVSEDVRAVEIRRGRSSETTNVDAGSGTITLDNRLRLYDPLASASVTPYAPSILPRKEVVVQMDGRQFTGMVEDWDLQYSPGGDSVTLVKLTDQLTTLTEQTLASGAGATGLSGSVIYQTASAVGWEMGRVHLDEGTETVGPHDIEGETNALEYMRKIANTESAMLFIAKDGTLTYRDRVSPRPSTGTRFADDGSGIPFTSIEISYGTEFLYTQTEISYPSGSVTATEIAQASDASIANYGVRDLTLDTYLSGSAAAQRIADSLVERYGEPELRIEAIEVNMDGLTQAQQIQLLELELGDGVEIHYTPNGIGEPIFRELGVDLIQHSMAPGSHFARFRLFVPMLLFRLGSVTGTSSTAGTATGGPNMSGSASGSSGTAGTVIGREGNFDAIFGTSSTAGTATGSPGLVGVIAGLSDTDAVIVGVISVTGSASGSSATDASVAGSPGLAGSASGDSGTSGSVSGAEGNVGSASGSSGTDGSVTGAIGFFGVVVGDSSETGTVTGLFGAVGVVVGSSGTAGSVTGTAQSAFVLDTSELDGTDTLSA
ncbi:MAG TPA: LamG-like jellyroll fold domain-containing protein, partial [Acidimicrobiia bacterium]